MQHAEVHVVPRKRVAGPPALDAREEGVIAAARAVQLAEGVSAADESDGLEVVEVHAAEDLSAISTYENEHQTPIFKSYHVRSVFTTHKDCQP